MNEANSLLINDERVFYDGLLGQPDVRVLGSHTIYAATQGDVEVIGEDGVPVLAPAVSVPPFVAHKVSTGNRRIRCVMVEPEMIHLDALPAFMLHGRNEFACFGWQHHLAEVARWIRQDVLSPTMTVQAFDSHVFGMTLPGRSLDERIAQVIGLIRRAPSGAHSAEECAALCHLSTSRFMHLFKSECGVSFRAFRTWKRARSLLNTMTTGESLTAVAHELGYSDSAYFSNSIRHYTGLRPKDIMAGARHIRVISGA